MIWGAALCVCVCVLPAVALWPWLSAAALPRPQRAAAAVAFGLALSSLLFFLWRVSGGAASHYAIFEAPFWTAIAATGFRRRPFAATECGQGSAKALFVAGAAAVILLVLASAVMYDWTLAHQHGGWDAWAIWNLKARFLAADAGNWRDAMAVVESHPDYPLLLSCAVARVWAIAGAVSIAAPIAIALLFFVATIATVAGSLHASRGLASAVTGVALMTVPTFAMLGASQMADVPLGCFTILALTLLAAPTPSSARLLLAGAAVGCCAWTKNEGLVVALVLPTAYLLVRLRRDGLAVVKSAAPRLAAGVAPLLLLVAWFKLVLAPKSEFLAGVLNAGGFHRWLEYRRLFLVIRSMVLESLTWGGWPVAGPIWLLALLVAFPRATRTFRPGDEVGLTAASLLLVQIVVFFAVYVMAPLPVGWHIGTSWFRLIGQMWPTAVWACAVRRGRF